MRAAWRRGPHNSHFPGVHEHGIEAVLMDHAGAEAIRMSVLSEEVLDFAHFPHFCSFSGSSCIGNSSSFQNHLRIGQFSVSNLYIQGVNLVALVGSGQFGWWMAVAAKISRPTKAN